MVWGLQSRRIRPIALRAARPSGLPVVKTFAAVLAGTPALPDVLRAGSLEEFNAGSMALTRAKAVGGGDYGTDDSFKREVWQRVVDVAEKYYDPGRFTTFAGYEYSSNPPMLHRNVLFAGGPAQTLQMRPFSKYDSNTPKTCGPSCSATRTRRAARSSRFPTTDVATCDNTVQPQCSVVVD